MQLVSLQEMPLLGLTTRTTNQAETSPQSAKIGQLWQDFFESAQLSIMLNSPMYGVYYDYASNMDGEYSVLVGKAIDAPSDAGRVGEFMALTLGAGRYLKFSAEGAMPQCVIDLWREVWGFFATPDCQYQRRYHTDFEVYISGVAVEIYIGVL